MRRVYIAAADGEEALAEELAGPLRSVGYDVVHHGTAMVGESVVNETTRLLATGSPIVVCATTRAVGSAWTHQVVNAAHAGGSARVFVVQMEREAFVEQLALKAKVARYCEDPARAVQELLDALAKHFPPTAEEASNAPIGEQYLDEPTSAVADVEAWRLFRGQLREEHAGRFPESLTMGEFLDRAGVRVGGRITRTGALLFAENPAVVNPATMVKCARYLGMGRDAVREVQTFEGTVPEQIIAARQYIAERARIGEAPNSQQAQSENLYEFPMIAVREIIANALTHRDYVDTRACVHVRLYTDRLEISSPGTWSGRELEDGVTYDLADLAGHSIKRNFRLAHLLSWIRLVEGEGSGVPTALRDCRDTSSPSPTVVQSQGFVTVTLQRRRFVVHGIGDPIAGEKFMHTRTMVLPPVPRMLPPSMPGFVGRDEELRALDTILEGSRSEGGARRVVLVSGMPGVGKTAFALHWAHRRADRFADGQLWVALRGYAQDAPVVPAEALRSMLEQLGLDRDQVPVGIDDRAALFRSLLAGKRMLLVLDDAGSLDQVMPLLPGDPECAVIITSRGALSGMSARYGSGRLDLDVVSVEEGAQLVRQTIRPERADAEPEAVAELVRLCGHLPLALRIAAERIAFTVHGSVADFVEDLRARTARLDVLALDDDVSGTVREVFTVSYRSLSAETARMFRALGFHPGPTFDVAAAAALADCGERAANTMLSRLVALHLVEELPGRRFTMHDLLRIYSAEVADYDGDPDQRGALERLLRFFVETAGAAVESLLHGRARWRATSPSFILAPGKSEEWLAAELPNLVAAITRSPGEVNQPLRIELAALLAPYLDLRGRYDLGAEVHGAALQLARSQGDAEAEVRALIDSGLVQLRLGRHDLALDLFRTAIASSRDAHTDPALTYQGLLHLGRALRRAGQYDEALDTAHQALTFARESGDRLGEAEVLADLGSVHERQERYEEAMEHLRTAIGISDEVGDSVGRGQALCGLGEVLARVGRFDEALSCLHMALTIARQIGNRRGEAEAGRVLARVLRDQGMDVEARPHQEEAVRLFTELGVAVWQ